MINFDERPILVFWETTKACLLACRHCRAEAMPEPAPGELSTEEGLQFIQSLTLFGRPYPVLILTGGDFLMRSDAFSLISRARELEIPVGIAPSVTSQLTDQSIQRMVDYGVKMVSISLDGINSTHESIRGVPGHYSKTVDALTRLVDAGLQVQVNTVVMRNNVAELPAIFELIRNIGVSVWEVFYLIHVGRGVSSLELTPDEYEDIGHFLFEASAYGITIRTVEGPFFRRIVGWREDLDSLPLGQTAERYRLGPLYNQLSQNLQNRLGAPTSKALAQSSGTRDGKGIIFVGFDGSVYPSGFLPLLLGNIRNQELADIYRDHPVLKKIRASTFSGKCGVCDYRYLCGGSRARAYMKYGDPLHEDPACSYTVK